MKVFLFLIAAVIAYFLYKMKSGGEYAGALSSESSSKRGQLSAEEKERIRLSELRELEAQASKQYGKDALMAMWRLACKYGSGSGVPLDFRKSEALHMAAVQEALYLKVTMEESDYNTDLIYPLGNMCHFDPEMIVDFYIEGKCHPVDLDLARKTAETLLCAGELKAGYLLREIEELKRLGYQEASSSSSSRFAFMLKLAEAGCVQAMYRISDWYSYGYADQVDKDKGALWKERARSNGNLRVCLEHYPIFIMDEEGEKKKEEYIEAYKKARSIYMQEKRRYLDRIETCGDLIREMDDRLKVNSVTPVGDAVLSYLKEAQWPEPSAYWIPGFQNEHVEEFNRARSIERSGKDYIKAAELYYPLAQAGNSEAMRRLGNIKRNILYRTLGDAQFIEGDNLLKNAARMGNVLACWNVDNEADASDMAALAIQGDYEAVLALASMIGEGKGGPANLVVKRAMLWYLRKRIGKVSQNWDGENVMIYLQAGRGLDLNIIDRQEEAACLLRADELDYAPGTFGLLRSYIGRMGYYNYEKKLAEKAMKAGYGRAEIIYENAVKEERGWEKHVGFVLREAQSGRAFNCDTNPEKRIECAKDHLSDELKLSEMVRYSTGLPSRSLINYLKKPINLLDIDSLRKDS